MVYTTCFLVGRGLTPHLTIMMYTAVCIQRYVLLIICQSLTFPHNISCTFILCRIAFDSQADEESTVVEYLHDDRDFPVFSRIKTGYGCEQLINILMSSEVSSDRVCLFRPTAVSENATFLIDVDAVRFSDLKSDDMGTWKAIGTKSTNFRITNRIIYFSPGDGRPLNHTLTRRYFVHKTYDLYKRIIVDIRGMCC